MGTGGLTRRLAAEALGTALLTAAVVGSGVMAERLADGNVALALLANALATGAALAVLILLLGPVSGAHLNPAVSVAFALRRELAPKAALAYAVAQVAGALAGVALAHAMFDLPLFAASTHSRAGAGQYLSEVVASFGLVGTIIGTIVQRPSATPYAVGLYIGAGYWFTASTSFANPAVTLARAFTSTFSGIAPSDVAAFVAAQIAGSMLAVAFFGWLLREARPLVERPSEP